MKKTEIRFDDLPALTQRVGEPFSPYGQPVTLTQEKINSFAKLTGDEQWIHVDVERAHRESPLHATIAHGFFLVSLIPCLRQRADLEIVGHSSVLNYGADKLRFLSPVPAGSSIHARGRIHSIEQKAKGTLIAEEIEIAIVGREAERPALSYLMLALYLP